MLNFADLWLVSLRPRLERLALAPFAWVLLAVAIIAGRQLGSGYGELLAALGDTDDATRLVEVRELMAGAPWFDTTLPRFGGDTPLVSHWSRLIDLPLALLLGLFGAFMSPAEAELAVRILWPSLMLAVLLGLIAREAELRGGRIAAAVVLVFGVCASSGIFQFIPGRIDHHNVQITGAVIGLLMLGRALTTARAGYGAGFTLGLGLAVGYEAIALVVPGLAIAGLIAATNQRASAGVANAATAFAATLAGAIVLTIAPSHWLAQTCDALSWNIALLAGAGATGLAVLTRYHARLSLAQRFAVLAAAGVAGAVLFGVADPVCLGGPFAQVDAAVKPIWLDKVQEAQTIMWLLGEDKAAFGSFFVFAGLGIASATANWRRERSLDALFLLALVPLSLALAVWQIKLLSYATWLPTLSLTLMALNVPRIQDIPERTTRLAAVVLCNQSTLGLMAGAALVVFGAGAGDAKSKPENVDAKLASKASCFSNAAIEPLGRLPKGRFAGDVDVGPFIVALTPHSVVAAPYHRLDRQIIATEALFQSPPAEAAVLLAALKADYLVACIPAAEIAAGGEKGENPAGLRAALRTGAAPAYLSPIDTGAKSRSLRVWRVLPNG